MSKNYRVIHEAIEFDDPEKELDSTSFGIISDYCFIRNLLEKVTVNQVIEVERYQVTQKSEFKERVFSHPNIPSVWQMVVNNEDRSKSKQCEDEI